jgi:transposase-like protein
MTKNIRGRDYARNKVRERDNYTCQECGKRVTPEQVAKHNERQPSNKNRMKSLDVHHLNGLCGKNSTGYDSVKDIGGLITLCHKCHYNRHDFSLTPARKKEIAIHAIRARYLKSPHTRQMGLQS